MLANPFSGKELFTYWKDTVTWKPAAVVEWKDLPKHTQERWNRMAAMINQRMKGEAS